MKKFYLLFGIATIGILLLGSMSLLVVAQEEPEEGPMDEGLFPGTYDILFDISLKNNWVSGPTTYSPSGKINTNLRYLVTNMISPLDKYFNAGFFTPGDPSDYQGPSFAINGDFIGTQLFVKLINDQPGLIDWQAALILGKNITISWMINEGMVPEDASEFLDLLPENLTLIEGAATPPFPVIRSTTNFGEFFDYQDLIRDYGYHGLPFFIPSIFYLDNLSAAYNYWAYEANMTEMFKGPDPIEDIGEYQHVTNSTTYIPGSYLTLELSFEWGNSVEGIEYGNASVWFNWTDSTGYLEGFCAEAYGDLDKDGILEAEEQFLIEMAFDSEEQADLPVKVGDQGEYLMDLNISVVVSDFENETEEVWINEFLSIITTPINDELDNIPLLNYTIDSMDGLYYHIDGYIFNLQGYLKDRFGFLFANENGSPLGIGSQEPALPPVQSYYVSIADMTTDGGQRQSTANFAINMFDAMLYMNSTEWFEGRSDVMPEIKEVWNETTQQYEKHINSTHLRPYGDIPGAIDAWIFDNNEWWNSWDHETESFEDHFYEMLGSEIHHGPPTVVEVPNSWLNCSWIYNETTSEEEWICETVYEEGTHPEWFFINDTAPWEDKPYYIVFLIQEFPERDYTSYIPGSNFYFTLGRLFGNDDNMNGEDGPSFGMGAMEVEPEPQEEEANFFMIFNNFLRPQDILPMPVRTPDWEITGGVVTFLEALSEQLKTFITSPEFIDFFETQAMEVDDPGDMINIDLFDFGLYWIENSSNAGIEGFIDTIADVTDNNADNKSDVHIEFSGDFNYLWTPLGRFDTIGLLLDLHFTYDFEEHPEPTTTPTTVPENTTSTTTSTSIGVEISPGFEFIFTLGIFVVLPLLYKKKRH